ncbi:hypothetical protein E2C01_056593 [Portunus trituberculatus]|uniref:Uncharacterized protein n=1 Tax=Portunus trituberculatus TaxID=210409 RepID=A0A5B7H003_PORTR|nr:hypothetical protein [Portunus trituberculatus]
MKKQVQSLFKREALETLSPCWTMIASQWPLVCSYQQPASQPSTWWAHEGKDRRANRRPSHVGCAALPVFNQTKPSAQHCHHYPPPLPLTLPQTAARTSPSARRCPWLGRDAHIYFLFETFNFQVTKEQRSTRPAHRGAPDVMMEPQAALMMEPGTPSSSSPPPPPPPPHPM